MKNRFATRENSTDLADVNGWLIIKKDGLVLRRDIGCCFNGLTGKNSRIIREQGFAKTCIFKNVVGIYKYKEKLLQSQLIQKRGAYETGNGCQTYRHSH